MNLQKYATTPLRPPFMKRNDIHGLRAFVIMPLLLHNLNSRLFPYSDLGLDVLFVTSGYFIATILNKRRQITYKTMFAFVYKRLRQLLPTYFAVVALFLTLSNFYLKPREQRLLVEESRSAFCLYSNLKASFLSDEAFEIETATFKLFANNWLMCVEIQFSLLIFLFFKCLFGSESTNKKLLIGIGALSCLAQLLSPIAFAREFTFLHIWQFMIGMAAFYWNHEHKQDLPTIGEDKMEWVQTSKAKFGPLQNFDFIATPVCLFLVLLVMIVNENLDLARIRCSIFAFLIIIVGTRQQSTVLTNCWAVFIGNHAYTIYFVHWPVIVFWKSSFGQGINFIDGLLIFKRKTML
ncbi:hypothetical protein M3Y97_00965200 [Aphelenchoides bicaudatus]|nr:hypothetical protein M3Y97_00965200 [Aphelenchoides bicaudatus]